MARQATGLTKIIIFSCQSFPSIKDLTIWASLLRGYLDLGVLEISYVVVEKEALLDAQQHPEKYPGLVGRVAGYCAFFVELTKEVHDTIIDRAEHTWQNRSLTSRIVASNRGFQQRVIYVSVEEELD
jgi:hypothetical protein